jgi:diguanylate cyclase (GGDEF)-like protein
MCLISKHGELESGSELDIVYEHKGVKRDFIVKCFFLEWHNTDAIVYVINDISETRKEIADLEEYAYRDFLTQLYNRAYGMKILDIWLHEKREFSLIFIDLDGLKYVNDEFGHEEGNIFITRACDYFRDFSESSVVCRIGGDEFMILASNCSYDEANTKMSEITTNLRNDEYQQNKEFSYSMSFGISSVNKSNMLSASELLSIADFRMYDDKKRNKLQAKKERESNNH